MKTFCHIFSTFHSYKWIGKQYLSYSKYFYSHPNYLSRNVMVCCCLKKLLLYFRGHYFVLKILALKFQTKVIYWPYAHDCSPFVLQSCLMLTFLELLDNKLYRFIKWICVCIFVEILKPWLQCVY